MEHTESSDNESYHCKLTRLSASKQVTTELPRPSRQDARGVASQARLDEDFAVNMTLHNITVLTLTTFYQTPTIMYWQMQVTSTSTVICAIFLPTSKAYSKLLRATCCIEVWQQQQQQQWLLV